MDYNSKNTLKRQLTRLVMIIAFVALAVSLIAYSYRQYISQKTSLLDNTNLLAKIIGDNSNTALAFNDPEDAKNVLNSLHNNKSVIAACLYDQAGTLFTSYVAKESKTYDCPPVQTSSHTFDLKSLKVFEGIIYDGKQLGTIFIHSNLDNLYGLLSELLITALIIIILAMIFAYIMTSKMQKRITKPLGDLTLMTRKYTEDNESNFGEIPSGSFMEVEALFESLTQMITRIKTREDERDAAEARIKDLNATLENKVIQRTKELEQAQKAMLEQAHHSGMAQVATGVLHNVGNVLNSVNISAKIIHDKVTESKISGFEQSLKLIKDNMNNLDNFFNVDPRGKKLLEYMTNLVDYTRSENKELLEEATSLNKNTEHIKVIVAMQQTYAKKGGLQNEETLNELVDNALQINMAALDRHQVTVEKDYAVLPNVLTDRNKVLQILINLMSNAKYAMDKTDDPMKLLKIVTEKVDDNQVAVRIIDNGIGIPKENLNKIFQHGFTTKKDGHGFGLHSSANAAKQLGGSLQVNSSGKGAEFILQIPIRTNEQDNEAH